MPVGAHERGQQPFGALRPLDSCRHSALPQLGYPGRMPTPQDIRFAKVVASMRWPLDNSAEHRFKYSTASQQALHGRLLTSRQGNLLNKTPWDNRGLGLDFGHGDPSRRSISYGI